MAKGHFDAEALYAALDSQRLSRRMNWKQVAHEAGISASTLTRMAQGKRPDVDSLAALLAWSGLTANQFVVVTERTSANHSDPLAQITAYLRADPHLKPEGAAALEAVLKAAYEKLRKD
jgi:transcriptional regulator with XRE-family HTH domain